MSCIVSIDLEVVIDHDGLMNAVETIMTVEDSQRYAAPRLMRNQQCGGDLRGEMDEVINLPIEGSDAQRTLSVFECERLLARLAQELPVAV